MDGTHRYDDIIHLSRPRSERHLPMPLSERAAQFAPFAALVGFEGAVREEARRTEAFAFLEEDEKAALDATLRQIRARLDTRPEVTTSYFVPDSLKSGGTYVQKTGTVRKIDDVEKIILFEDGTTVEIPMIRTLTFRTKSAGPTANTHGDGV